MTSENLFELKKVIENYINYHNNHRCQ
ncbi:MAG: IS3 family transposase [Cetobacterium sp.]